MPAKPKSQSTNSKAKAKPRAKPRRVTSAEPNKEPGTALVPVTTVDYIPPQEFVPNPYQRARAILLDDLESASKDLAHWSKDIREIQKLVVSRVKKGLKAKGRYAMSPTDATTCFKQLVEATHKVDAMRLAYFDRLGGQLGFGDGWIDDSTNRAVTVDAVQQVDREITQEAELLLRALVVTKIKHQQEQQQGQSQ